MTSDPRPDVIECMCGCGGRIKKTRWPSQQPYYLQNHRQRMGVVDYDWDNLADDLQRLGSVQAVADMLGVHNKTVWDRARGIEYQRTCRRGPGQVGRIGELIALELLPGSVDQLRTGLEPFDLLWNGQRVNVKTARPGVQGWQFNVATGRGKCDAYFLVALDGTDEYHASWLIPAADCAERSGIVIYPSMRGKWATYRYEAAY